VNTTLIIYRLIDSLKKYNVFLRVINGQIKITLPAQLPEEAKPLLAELKARKQEAITYLKNREPFDQEAAQELLADTLERLNADYPFGAIPWAKLHKPELWKSCQAAEKHVNSAYQAGDMETYRQAVAEFERANLALFAAYPGLFWQPGMKRTGGKVWQLTNEQAKELEFLFAATNAIKRKGSTWWPVEKWLERAGQGKKGRKRGRKVD
jgi:hypothetical protein